jgi:hypothetical protein
VETGGWKLLHVGDAAVTGAEIRPYGLASRGLDLAFLPFWYLLDAQGDELLQAVGARVVVGVHVPAPAAASEMFGSPGSLEALEEAVTARHPKVRLLVEPGDRWVMRR